MPKLAKLQKFATMMRIWSRCTACPIGFWAQKKAFYRGSIDAKVVFIGEGPGKSEDVLGTPFIGRAGKLLDQAIRDAGSDPGVHFFCNLVLCRPCDSKSGGNRAPKDIEVEHCSDRLKLTLEILQPKVVVWLGKVPQSFAPRYFASIRQSIKYYLYHPAYLLRCGGERSKEYKDFVLRLKEALKYGA